MTSSSLTAPVVALDPLFDEAGAAAVLDLCTRHGSYRTYAAREHIDTELGRGLAQRHDSMRNFLRLADERDRGESTRVLTARTSYFREEYAYDGTPLVPGIEPFLGHAGLADAARAVHGRPIVAPSIAYANLLVPGQELAVHTDVPEFRGANRKSVPQWLLVVMHHSGLFDEWRLPIATGIAWFQRSEGGALLYWPDGPIAPGRTHPIRPNTALVLDTDSVFHGVASVGSVATEDLPPIATGVTLTAAGADTWSLRDATGAELATYAWDELRFSVSWKAYCLRDEAERHAWQHHTDDLDYDTIVGRLLEDLRARGRVSGEVDQDRTLGLRLIDEYIRFPRD
ncbi:MAG TPA: hypothetical protein VLV81_13185 [Acidimicrobiia bacterium]|nr:hypothetical protein [Acidimicrobiia bacterium]